MPGVAKEHRAKAIACLKWAHDANASMTAPGIDQGRFDLLRKRRDEMLEEYVDEMLCAAAAYVPGEKLTSG